MKRTFSFAAIALTCAFVSACSSNIDPSVKTGGEAVLNRIMPAGLAYLEMDREPAGGQTCKAVVASADRKVWAADDNGQLSYSADPLVHDTPFNLNARKTKDSGWVIDATDLQPGTMTAEQFEAAVKKCLDVFVDRRDAIKQRQDNKPANVDSWKAAARNASKD